MLEKFVFLTEVIAIIIAAYRIFGRKFCISIEFIVYTIISLLVKDTIIFLKIEKASFFIFVCLFFFSVRLYLKKRLFKLE